MTREGNARRAVDLALRCTLLPLTSVEPVSDDRGLSSEFLTTLALQRAHQGGVGKSEDRYVDGGHPVPSYLTRVFDDLAHDGLLALTEDLWEPRQVGLTKVGYTLYAQLSGPPRRVALPIPDPQFPTKTPAGRRSRILVFPCVPGDQPDPTSQAGAASVEQLRWARSDDERLPVLTAAPGGEPVPRRPHEASNVEHQLRWAPLPVRSPGQHMHPQLRRPPGAGDSGGGGSTR